MRAGRAEQGGQPELGGHGMHGGGVAVRQRPGDGDRAGGGDQLLAFEPGVDQVDDVAGSADRLATVSFLTLPPSR